MKWELKSEIMSMRRGRWKVAKNFLGDLTDGPKVLSWLTNQDVFAVGDQIEDVNRKMLDKILDERDFVAVYFYSDVCGTCREVSF